MGKSNLVIGKARTYRHTDPVWTDNDDTLLVHRAMRIYEVSGDVGVDRAARRCAQELGGVPEAYIKVGRPPWLVGISGQRVMIHRQDDVLGLLEDLAVPAACSDRYHPVAAGSCWLFYYSEPYHLNNIRTRYYCGEALGPEFAEFLSSDSTGVYLLEHKMMAKLLDPMRQLTWQQRMKRLRENSWVKYRLENWLDDRIVPVNWFSFGMATAMIYLTWRDFFHGMPNAAALAWDTTWLGKAY